MVKSRLNLYVCVFSERRAYDENIVARIYERIGEIADMDRASLVAKERDIDIGAKKANFHNVEFSRHQSFGVRRPSTLAIQLPSSIRCAST
jgi:hypothetical protein